MFLISYSFLAFVLLLLLLYYLVPGKLQWTVLLLASIWFYLCAGSGAVWALCPLLTVVTTWILANRIGRLTVLSKEQKENPKESEEQRKEIKQRIKKKQRRLLQAGLILNFGLLLGLKYAPTNGGLPLGISYYTFMAMGYLIDVYQKKYLPEKNLAKTALFVLYFPQLTAGPIGRFGQMKQELYSPCPFSWQRIKFGAERVAWGFFKKLVLADRMQPIVQELTGRPEYYQGVYALLGIVGYGLWLYADFSSGMDIVIGISQMFGITLAENFNHPFAAGTLGEFWRRWHMSLMQWFREYIYFPVSTSKCSRKVSGWMSRLIGKKRASKFPAYIATMTIWLITGIWHGTGGRYILWGLANGIVILISQEWTGYCRQHHRSYPFAKASWYLQFAKIRTFLLFCVLSSLQYFSLEMFWKVGKGMFTHFGLLTLKDGRLAEAGLSWPDGMVLVLGFLLLWAISLRQKKGSVREQMEALPGVLRCALVMGLVLVTLVMGVYGYGFDAKQFIYNQF